MLQSLEIEAWLFAKQLRCEEYLLTKPPLSHYAPKFANKAWADDNKYITYLFCAHSGEVKKKPNGWKQWGRKRGLYTWPVENALNEELETATKPIYKKICSYSEITYEERIIWAQFLLSQLVRTPTYIKYEEKAREKIGITVSFRQGFLKSQHLYDFACSKAVPFLF